MLHLSEIEELVTFLDFGGPLFSHGFLEFLYLFFVVFVGLGYLFIPGLHVVLNGLGPLLVGLFDVAIILFLQVALVLVELVLKIVDVGFFPPPLLYDGFLPESVSLDVVSFLLLVQHIVIDYLEDVLELFGGEDLD